MFIVGLLMAFFISFFFLVKMITNWIYANAT